MGCLKLTLQHGAAQRDHWQRPCAHQSEGGQQPPNVHAWPYQEHHELDYQTLCIKVPKHCLQPGSAQHSTAIVAMEHCQPWMQAAACPPYSHTGQPGWADHCTCSAAKQTCHL